MSLQLIYNTILLFLLILTGDPHYPRKLVQDFVNFMDQFIRTVYLPAIRNEIFLILKQKNIPLDEFEQCFDKYSNVFDKFLTEHKRMNIFRAEGYLSYKIIEIKKKLCNKIVDNSRRFISPVAYVAFIPLRKSLKAFLEIPGLFYDICNYIKILNEESKIISNILQANLWKKKYCKIFCKSIVLPLYIFADELECGNGLGSRAGINKLLAVYASIACLPPEIASQLASIILTLLIHSKDKKDADDKDVFKALIGELKFLRDYGIVIKVNKKFYRVKFQLVLVLGDNLGLNGLFGFVESFHKSFWCRICKAPSELMETLTEENESLLRNPQNYKNDVETKNSKLTGVKRDCIFHQVSDFHLTLNLTIDMMHDVLEGVCMYVMAKIIYYFIEIKKYFTLEQLNTWIEEFDYGMTEIDNKPPSTIFYNSSDGEYHLKYSASEMLCLVRYFGLIVGDAVPCNDNRWKLYIYLRELIGIITSPRLTKSMILNVKKLVKNINLLYIEFFEYLKPKFHNLVHYARILYENGPCIHFSAMRYESRHRIIKANVVSTSCKKNVLETVSIKQMLYMHSLYRNYKYKKIDLGSTDESCFVNLPEVDQAEDKTFYKEIRINGITYKLGMFIVTNLQESETELK